MEIKATFSNSSGLKSVFDKLYPAPRGFLLFFIGTRVDKLRRISVDGALVWTVGLTVKVKLRFQISPA